MIIYGHRGAKGEAPENTLPGFAYGYQVGVRAFELDVRLTADHEIVIMHDATVDRTTNGVGPVSELTAGQIAGLEAKAAFPDWPEVCRVPTFKEFLAFLPPDITSMEVEIKRDEPARLEILCPMVAAQIADYGWESRVTITSFDATALQIMRRCAPHLPRGFIARYEFLADLDTALEAGCARAAIPVSTGSLAVVEKACAHGLFITGWPGNTPEQLQTCVEWQVSGTTTDFPGVALPFLRERGLFGDSA